MITDCAKSLRQKLKLLLVTTLWVASHLAQAADSVALPTLSDGWSRWAVLAPEDAGNWCCFGALAGTPKTCDLDSERLNFGTLSEGGKNGEAAIRALKTRTMHIYANIQHNSLQRLRVFGADCPVSAKTNIRVLENIDTASSLRWLNTVSVSASMKEAQILPALAMHEGAAPLLFTIAKQDAVPGIRRQSWFWLSQINAVNLEREAMLALCLDSQNVARNERNAIIFALSQLKAPRAGNALIQVVEDLKLGLAIRKEALFWLGQMEGDQGLDYLDRMLSSG